MDHPISSNKTSNNKESKIQIELLKQLYKQIQKYLPGSIIVTLILIMLLWRSIDVLYIIIWSILNITIILISYFGIIKAQKLDVNTKNFIRQIKIVNYCTLLHGMVWGLSAVVLINSNNNDYNLLLTVVLLLVITQITFLSAATKKTVFFAIVPIFSSIILFTILFNNGYLQYTLAIFSAVYFYFCFVFHTNAHNTQLSLLVSEFDNTRLHTIIKNQDQNTNTSKDNKSRFLAAASHDLRQPIHAQTLLIEELIERVDDPALINLIRDIKISTNALHELFDSIMDISKLDSNKITTKIEIFPLRELLDTIALEFKAIANDRQLRFEIIAPSVNIKSDRNLLMRVIQNLVSNAIKYTLKGSVLITTRIRGDFIRIEIRDSGIGIPPDKQETIFQEFYQIPDNKINNPNSLGIGLSIVHRLSQLLNHKLEVISEVGRGSTFIILVPLIKSESKVNTSRLRVSCNLDTFNGNRVLVIDDDELILRSMQSLLTHWGCSVTAVTSGKQACELILPETPRPDLIIADYRMKDGETGIDAIKLIKRMLNISVPTLIVTGDTSEATLGKIKAYGFTHLHKPIAPAKLRSFMRFIFDEN